MNKQKKIALFVLISSLLTLIFVSFYFLFQPKKNEEPVATEKVEELSILEETSKRKINRGELSSLLAQSKVSEVTPTIVEPTLVPTLIPTLVVTVIPTAIPTSAPVPTTQPTSVPTTAPIVLTSTGADLGVGTTEEKTKVWNQIWELRNMTPVETESFKVEYDPKTRLFNVFLKESNSVIAFTNWLTKSNLNLILDKYFIYIQI